MKFFKVCKRIFIVCFILAVASVVINSHTRFFKDIGTYIPYLGSHYPFLCEYIGDLSDKTNEELSKLPTPREMYAKFRHVELPIDPDDVASNSYYASDTMLNFYNKQNFSVAVNGTELDAYGVMKDENDKYIVYRFLDSNGETLEQFTDETDTDGNYRKIMRIPNNSYQFVIFTGSARYGDFSSQVFDYVYLSQSSDGVWSVTESPVYENNITEYEKDKSMSAALKSTYSVCSDNDTVKALAETLTAGYATDYEKALILHDWVCKNIYYDNDSITGSYNTAAYVATDVLSKKSAVCLGYSNLYAALCRSISIPCNVVTGYALGVNGSYASAWTAENINTTEANHAWNEVYLDGRWVIVDTTWDSKNKITNSIQETDEDISHLYFDANIKFFSTNHKILDYVKR